MEKNILKIFFVGNLALQNAVVRKNHEIAELLLNNGAQVNLKDGDVRKA